MKKNKRPVPKLIAAAVCAALSAPVYAAPDGVPEEGTTADQAVLETVQVRGKRRISRKDNEVTGLGKVVKSSADIDKEQILGIRDLTRYDPGISVVEQGRGATSGYAIRGVDKNRVALLVDGLAQAQSYTTLFSNANGGAINEIEYENIQSIELSKGASSAEYGNGALGGAVGFRTKEPGDVIKDGQSWGLDTKNAYSSKNNQWTHSVAAAGRLNGFEGLAIFTHRQGRETEAHSAAGDYLHSISRLSGYADVYDMRPGTTANQYGNNWFLLQNECPSLNCAPKAGVLPTRDEAGTLRTHPPLTAEELANRVQSVHPVETLSAKDYTGSERILPNPMDYASRSWLLKGGFRLSPQHYIGGVYEHTAQQYDIRDMTVPAYYMPSENAGGGKIKTSPYGGNRIGEGLRLHFDNQPASLNWTRSRFFDERHRKTRQGVFYRYTGNGQGSWLDNAQLSFDRQEIALDSRMHDRRCAAYPAVDASCRASADKPWSYYQSERNRYSEERDQFRLNLEKAFEIGASRHRASLLLGAERQRSVLQRSDYFYEYAKQDWQSVRNGLPYTPNGSYSRPYVYQALPAQLIRTELCDLSGQQADLGDCSARTIKGKNYFIALRDTVSFGKYADWGVGVRYDYHRYTSDDPWTAAGTYRNWSWNSGLTVKPTDYLALSYRISSGFRVPAFYEMFGRRIQGSRRGSSADFQHIGTFKPEKSLNQEFGIGVKGSFGHLEASYFHNRYKDMITLAERRGLHNNQFGYHNAQNVTLGGINVLGKIYWDGIFDRLPEGLYATLAYNRIKVRKREVDPAFTNTADPLLDAVQPGRYIVGFGYDHPEGKWGVNTTMTYSKAKENSELSGRRYVGSTAYSSEGRRTKSWYTYDLTAYVNLKNSLTLRAGIYNLTNRKYSTWESVRQSSANAVNADTAFHSARYAAPGRSFVLGLEMKF